jgi:hypothetical protein
LLPQGIEQISGSNNRTLKTAGKRFATTGYQMVDNFNVRRKPSAFISGKEVRFDYFTTVRAFWGNAGLKQSKITGPPHATTHTLTT